MKVSTSGNKLTPADYFTMSNTVAESNADEDLGSGGAMLLPNETDASGTVRQLAVGAGKDANIYVVDTRQHGQVQFQRQHDLSGTGRARCQARNLACPPIGTTPCTTAAVGDSIRAYPDYAGEAGHHSQLEDGASISVSRRDAKHFFQRHLEWNSVGRRQQQSGGFVCL